ncbi:MAG: hypothetical protein M3Q07_00730 [Pseudobdellovibrionaceae bacterium]|uniref:hypothetical protein n=1 Tax=Oligoflexus sp. TaxID=1971216 RepID=UPI0027BD3455|nr:hypothetical protein [Oligoflexus sp.]MDQ3230316.1 hypothetical protein [Pseudobdellovibrionaceae bacterium]HYX37698.1 hypothetical protein [Oligoflexus sp.]
MGNGYYDEKAAQRQRVCFKCFSFVTHDKVDDQLLACPLCGNRIEMRPTARVARISATELAGIIAVQVKNRLLKKK